MLASRKTVGGARGGRRPLVTDYMAVSRDVPGKAFGLLVGRVVNGAGKESQKLKVKSQKSKVKSAAGRVWESSRRPCYCTLAVTAFEFPTLFDNVTVTDATAPVSPCTVNGWTKVKRLPKAREAVS